MLVVLEKRDGKFNEAYLESLGMLEDGRYLVDVRSLNAAKTEREFQKEYFALIDIVTNFSGEAKYDLHNRFKSVRKVESTADFSIQDWVDFIEAFKWLQFKELDLIL